MHGAQRKNQSSTVNSNAYCWPANCITCVIRANPICWASVSADVMPDREEVLLPARIKRLESCEQLHETAAIAATGTTL